VGGPINEPASMQKDVSPITGAKDTPHPNLPPQGGKEQLGSHTTLNNLHYDIAVSSGRADIRFT